MNNEEYNHKKVKWKISTYAIYNAEKTKMLDTEIFTSA
jgi:hypothetical protein